MQLSYLLLAQLVSSVILPIAGLGQAGKYLSPADNGMTHSIGSISESLVTAAKGSNKLFKKLVADHQRENQVIAKNIEKVAVKEGKERRLIEAHVPGVAPIEANSLSKSEHKLVPKSKLERQQSFKTSFNEDFDLQGRVGACHVFATLEVIHGATNGLKLSKEKLFLDHLLSMDDLSPRSVEDIVDHNLQEIRRIRKLRGSAKCINSLNWEGGNFKRDFELLKTYGGVVVPNHGDWKEVEHMIRSLRKVQKRAIFRKSFNSERQTTSLRSALLSIFDRGTHTPEEDAERNVISGILHNLEPEFFKFEDSKNNLLENTYELIKIIEKKGTAYLSVDSKRFYRAVKRGKKLAWSLNEVENSNHAVALVGYSVGKNVFYIKDSNTAYLIEISPKNLFLSMRSGAVLVPKKQ